MIQIYSNSLGEEELQSIKEVFDSRWIGKGPKTEEFINNFSKKIITETAMGVAFVSANSDQFLTTTCCTEGVFQILDLLELKNGDEVIIPSMSFVGIANAVVSRGAKPVFCDSDRYTLNPSVEDIQSKITNQTKAVILLHYAGTPCKDIFKISELCKANNIFLIEDNANSPFSRIDGVNTGTIGDFGVWSFDAMKILVTGDGGLIYSNKENIDKLKKMVYLGLESSSGLSNTVDEKWWKFEVSSPSRRSISNDIQAAIGIQQLKKVDTFISKRKEIHKIYTEELTGLPGIRTPNIPKNSTSSYYMYHIQTNKRDELAAFLRRKGIYTTFRYYPLHLVKFYNSFGEFPNTEYAANKTLCIPLHQNLSDGDIDYIITQIKKFK